MPVLRDPRLLPITVGVAGDWGYDEQLVDEEVEAEQINPCLVASPHVGPIVRAVPGSIKHVGILSPVLSER